MTELEFIKLLDPVIAKVHCGHTELQYSDNFGNYIYENGLFIPFSINYLKAKAYIVRNYKEDISEYLGSEIISINGVSAAEMLKKLYSNMNGDGFNTQNILYTINHSPVSTFSKLFNYTDSYNFQCIKPGEKNISDFKIKAIKYQEIQSVIEEKYPKEYINFKFEKIDNLNTAVITITSFVKHDNSSFSEFLRSSFEQIFSLDIQNLIVDVRGNDGGHPDLAIDLLQYITDKDFVYFKTHIGNKWNDPIKPHERIFEGNLFILFDGGCFSTSGHFISLIKYHSIGTLIGQESGSTFSCNDNSKSFVLPNTKIGGKVARTTFETAVTGFRWDRGILPDHLVESDLMDIIDGVDTIMEYALDLISESIK